ncbi:uncharacterized protein NECHADRAFT_79666 [Fusarium vanettenii 77-13-4]|uniref:C2H2-type domain-containing protein n=1 Tax=Fusarium vanettenii (strain ATCC MYA-4622 / CBS 123669 / FGSC 9596 / NRRL 45880 / 77-13-4) TaxID=660122 RepID=C7Z851_FUSV7|nr:uncharacterized protein NECHADRAFT_79666 [Fusarium vanettenii 77-13-4]EEU39935.1 hypothetical protein NECHADRAFT_79666 [Fusarium vanettenii 77-13-4]
MEGLEADNFSCFNYSGDVSNDASTPTRTYTPDDLTAFGETSCVIATTGDLEPSQGQPSLSTPATTWNYQSSAQPSGQALLPLLPQPNFDWSTTYSMDEAARANEQPHAGSFIPIDGAPEPLERIGQTGHGTLPPNPSAVERHEDNQNLQQRCPHSSCTNKRFRDKGNLDRHMREVHSSQTFFCPVVSCQRNKRGFNRRYNLLDHQKRRHRQNIPGISEGRLNGDQIFQEKDDASESTLDGSAKSRRARQNEGTTNEEGLRVKLESLRATRAELDEDIEALEKALSIIGNDYS